MKTLNKSDFIEILGARCSMTATESEKVINTLEEIIYETLGAGGVVQWHGFGRFSAYQTKPVVRVSPSTGSVHHIRSHMRPKFLPGEKLKRAVK